MIHKLGGAADSFKGGEALRRDLDTLKSCAVTKRTSVKRAVPDSVLGMGWPWIYVQTGGWEQLESCLEEMDLGVKERLCPRGRWAQPQCWSSGSTGTVPSAIGFGWRCMGSVLGLNPCVPSNLTTFMNKVTMVMLSGPFNFFFFLNCAQAASKNT